MKEQPMIKKLANNWRITVILCLVLGCFLIAFFTVIRLNASVYPRAVPYKSSTFEYRDYYHNGFAALQGEVHSYFQTEDAYNLVTTHLAAEDWQKKDFTFVDSIFPLYDGYYPPQRTRIDIGSFSYSTYTVIILSFDEKTKTTIIEKITYTNMFYYAR